MSERKKSVERVSLWLLTVLSMVIPAFAFTHDIFHNLVLHHCEGTLVPVGSCDEIGVICTTGIVLAVFARLLSRSESLQRLMRQVVWSLAIGALVTLAYLLFDRPIDDMRCPRAFTVTVVSVPFLLALLGALPPGIHLPRYQPMRSSR